MKSHKIWNCKKIQPIHYFTLLHKRFSPRTRTGMNKVIINVPIGPPMMYFFVLDVSLLVSFSIWLGLICLSFVGDFFSPCWISVTTVWVLFISVWSISFCLTFSSTFSCYSQMETNTNQRWKQQDCISTGTLNVLTTGKNSSMLHYLPFRQALLFCLMLFLVLKSPGMLFYCDLAKDFAWLWQTFGGLVTWKAVCHVIDSCYEIDSCFF